jgi:hypothetical protein
MHTFPLYIRHPKDDIAAFRQLVTQDDRIKEHRKRMQLEAARVVPELASDGNDSDEYITHYSASSEKRTTSRKR